MNFDCNVPKETKVIGGAIVTLVSSKLLRESLEINQEGFIMEGINQVNSKDKICHIEPDENTANQIALTGEFRQPEWSESRNAFIFIKKKEFQRK